MCAIQTVIKKLEDATNNTKSWKHKVAEHEGLLRLIQPGNDAPTGRLGAAKITLNVLISQQSSLAECVEEKQTDALISSISRRTLCFNAVGAA